MKRHTRFDDVYDREEALPFPDRMCVAIILTEDRNPRTVVVWLIEIDPV